MKASIDIDKLKIKYWEQLERMATSERPPEAIVNTLFEQSNFILGIIENGEVETN